MKIRPTQREKQEREILAVQRIDGQISLHEAEIQRIQEIIRQLKIGRYRLSLRIEWRKNNPEGPGDGSRSRPILTLKKLQSDGQ